MITCPVCHSKMAGPKLYQGEGRPYGLVLLPVWFHCTSCPNVVFDPERDLSAISSVPAAIPVE
jgi:hypothetical protein